MLGVNSEQKECMQHYISDSIYGLTLAWITSENSTKQLECRLLLTRSSSLDSIFCWLASLLGCPESTASICVPSPTLSLLRCPESTAPVRGSTPTLVSVVPPPTACPLLSLTNSLSRPLTTSGYAEISSPKNPLSGFAPKQTKESSAWRATYIVLHKYGLVFDDFIIFLLK